MLLVSLANRISSMIEIKIPSDPKLLSIVRAMIGQLCEVMNCSSTEQGNIVLAVDEACANIIKHTYHGDPKRIIEIVCEADEDKLEISLQDEGPPVDFARIVPRDLNEVRPGGLGTYFIRSLMDEVVYEHRQGGGNVLRMIKRFRKNGS
jgi:anti-sigma regulatory factor (Ser/Thr protein kinase)